MTAGSGASWVLKPWGRRLSWAAGDQMGLGKTLQTLTFMAFLKKMRDQGGPNLVVAPLAVVQNWANECKKFTPSLSYMKILGGRAERDELFTRMDVNFAEFDVFITSYDTFKMEESFFTDTIEWCQLP